MPRTTDWLTKEELFDLVSTLDKCASEFEENYLNVDHHTFYFGKMYTLLSDMASSALIKEYLGSFTHSTDPSNDINHIQDIDEIINFIEKEPL